MVPHLRVSILPYAARCLHQRQMLAQQRFRLVLAYIEVYGCKTGRGYTSDSLRGQDTYVDGASVESQRHHELGKRYIRRQAA
jgi:hypothetical protein